MSESPELVGKPSEEPPDVDMIQTLPDRTTLRTWSMRELRMAQECYCLRSEEQQLLARIIAEREEEAWKPRVLGRIRSCEPKPGFEGKMSTHLPPPAGPAPILDSTLGADAAPAIVMRETASEFIPPSPEACLYVLWILRVLREDCVSSSRFRDVAAQLRQIRHRVDAAADYLLGKPLSDEALATVRRASVITDRDAEG